MEMHIIFLRLDAINQIYLHSGHKNVLPSLKQLIHEE